MGQESGIHPDESQELIDRRAEVPDLEPFLRPGERVINVEPISVPAPTKYPSAYEALKRLTDAEYRHEIGEHGPSIAARATKEGKEIAELRLFEVVFGRDSLQVASNLVDRFPKLVRATVMRLAELQGVSENPQSEEEPGRIVHEVRSPNDPIAQRITREHGWEWPYYGTVDATPMFVRAIAAYCQREGVDFLREKYTGKDGKKQTVAEALQASIGWMRHRMDANPEGLLEFKRTNPGGIENQVWKDSWDAYFHTDGTMANHEQGIASVEVQALSYDALLDAADLYERLGQHATQEQRKTYAQQSSELRTRAERIRTVIIDKLWIEDEKGGYFALGTDRDERGNLRPLKIRTSNMGHLLNSRLLDGYEPETVRRRESVIRELFSPDMLNASGIRTLSKSEKRFRPGAYHNGTVWLWDTYYISQGLERQGYHQLAQELNKRIWSVVDKFKKFPEFARGGDEAEPMLNTRIVDIEDSAGFKNRIEQPPQEIQAWTVAAILDAKYKYGEKLLHPARSKIDQDPRKRELENAILTRIHKST